MRKWKEVKLGTIIRTNVESYSKKDNWKFINYLDTGSITENKIDQLQKLVIGVDKIPSRAKRKVSVGDIIYSTVRPNQKHYGQIKAEIKNLLVSTGFVTIRVIKDIAYTDFIYWFLSQNSIVDELHQIGEHSTSTYPSIKPGDIEKLNLKLPKLSEQKQIAKTLSNLDKKITLLREQNQTLEELAQTLFKRWFVEFEFPKSSPPYKEEYPKGEVVKTIHNPSKLKTFRKHLKNNPTPAEAKRYKEEYPKGEVVKTIHNPSKLKTFRKHLKNNPTPAEAKRYKEEYPKGEVVKTIHNLPKLKTFRKHLRNNLTPAEAKLWTYLKNKQLDGRKFRRQHSVAHYILDFYCPAEKIAIELDGEIHNTIAQSEHDYERDLFLNHYGIKVLRFENKVVFEHPESLLDAVREEFGGGEDHPAFQAPLLFKEGNLVGMGYKSAGGKMVESELGEIPEGWRVGRFDEIIINHDSKRIPLSSNQRLKKQGIYPYHGATSIMDYIDDYIFDGRFLLLGEDGTVVDDKGYPILQFVEGKIWVNNHAHVLEGKNPYTTNYLFLLLKRTRISQIVTGAVQLKINQGNLNSLEVLIPKRDSVESFNLNTEGLINKIFSNNQEIQTLTQLRDTLLPKLMSGELRVNMSEP